jgi:alkaline phosphatase D
MRSTLSWRSERHIDNGFPINIWFANLIQKEDEMNVRKLAVALGGAVLLMLTTLVAGAPVSTAGMTNTASIEVLDSEVAAPQITHGPIAGEVSQKSVVLWARGNTTGTLAFEVSETSDFMEVSASASVEIDEAGDFIGKKRIEDLKPDQAYHYRVALTAGDQTSEPISGQFSTAPAADSPAGFDFTFGAGLGGQGYCRDPETGWTIFETMLAEQPDFFLLMGDSVYVDSACPSPQNVPGAEGPYADLTGFHTRYRYHLEDPHYAALLARTPVYVTWDDHEILDNFSGVALSKINPQLFADGRQAFFDFWPITGTEDDPYRMYRKVSYGALADFFILDTRSYRDPVVNWDPSPVTLQPKSMLGANQFTWLQEGLADSQATWKFIVTSVPLSYATGWPQPQVDGRDGWANYSERSGYETELMALLFFIESHDIQNIVFLAGDTHWPFAISYDPDRDGQPDFYELGSSPMSSIPLPPPDKLDPSFNPTVLYAEGEFMGELFNFGHVSVADDGALTFRVVDKTGTEHYTLTLTPE